MIKHCMLLKTRITSNMPLRKAKFIIAFGVILILLVSLKNYLFSKPDRIIIEDRLPLRLYEEQCLYEAMLSDKGTGCDVPNVEPVLGNPIAKTEEEQVVRPICPGPDWVQCYLSECNVTDEILNKTKDLKCIYQDLIYVNDWETMGLGDAVTVIADGTYTLERSDHVKVSCTATHSRLFTTLSWSGFKVGFRNLPRAELPQGREKYPNILLFGFDSTSKNGFIRKMPKSYKVLVEKYKSVVLNKYHIVGDGTVAAMFAMLAGQTQLELPELRRGYPGHALEDIVLIFSILKEYGYRTVYFEDSPEKGTFTFRLRGFMRQPTHHYMYSFLKAARSKMYCLGDRMCYSAMIDLTRQFFKLPGPKFMLNWIVDIIHDDPRLLRWADDEFSEFLLEFFNDGTLKNTAVFVLGDHGSRYSDIRAMYEGKVEERLPLMSIRLPDELRGAGAANAALQANRDTLTTPFDIHTTLLYLTGLEEYKNEYKVPGADMLRGNNLMETINANRSCAEAGLLAHWCVCLQWRRIEETNIMYQLVADAFVDYINSLTKIVRNKCALRTLKSVKWVTKKQNRNEMIVYVQSDVDGYLPKFNKKQRLHQEYYQIQIELGPGSGLYEATASYSLASKLLTFHERDVSRINAYRDEPKCILNQSPHLAKYCYCY